MESLPYTPEKAWQMALDQLKMEMPKAAFDTWVQYCEFVSFEDGMFTVGVLNQYNRDWLESHLTSTARNLLTGILNQTVDAKFVVLEKGGEEIDPLDEDKRSEPEQGKKKSATVTLQAEYRTIYDKIVQPDQVIVFPGYFLRYLPLLGVELAWLYIGFRQAAYEAGAAKKPGRKFGAPAKKIARYAGLSSRTFWRYVGKPEIWKKLRWFVQPVEDEPRWHRGTDGRPHQSMRYYRVSMSMPLTPYDEASLRKWLYRHLGEGKSTIEVLQTALETPVEDLIPLPNAAGQIGDFSGEPHTVQQLLEAVCPPISETDRPTFQDLSNQLAQYLMPSKDLVFLTHYFVEHWLPELGSGPGWLVTLLRDRCYLNRRTGEMRDEVNFSGGYAEAAWWLGIKRVKTVWEWLRCGKVSIFIMEIGKDFGAWENSSRRFKVCLGEPMSSEDQAQADKYLNGTPYGEIGTHRELTAEIPIGGNGTHRKAESSESVGAVVTHSGGNGTHKHGANGTLPGAVDTHTVGGNGTSQWRDWHSLNTLTLKTKNQENTLTTTSGQNGSKPANQLLSEAKTVVGSTWNLKGLLSHNHISSKHREYLLENKSSGAPLVSWLLYAASRSGTGIRDPVAHAVSRLLEDPGTGAGESYDRLANLPSIQLAKMVKQALNWQRPVNLDWRKVMDTATQGRLGQLANLLDIDVSHLDVT